MWKLPFRHLPTGEASFGGIPFRVAADGDNRGLRAFTVAAKDVSPQASEIGAVAIDARAGAIYVLHTASYQNAQVGRVMAYYDVVYADGARWSTPIRNKLELADLSLGRNLGADAIVGWIHRPRTREGFSHAVYVTRLQNPEPDKEITRIEFRAAHSAATVSILGLTIGDGTTPLLPLPGTSTPRSPAAPGGLRGRLEVTVRTDDHPTPARIEVLDPEGRFHVPAQGLNYGPEQRRFFYSTGAFELDVPAGEHTIRVEKGPEYRPVQTSVVVTAGDTTRRTIDVERWIDLPRLGWFSGDMHIHPFDQEPDDTATCLLAEDLHVGNLLIWSDGFSRRVHGRAFFRGRPETWPDDSHIAYYNEEYRHDAYGHLCLVDLKELITPMGGGTEYDRPDFPPNAEILDRVHAQGGYASIAHLVLPQSTYAAPGELSVDVALGKADSVDISLAGLIRKPNRSLDLWYRLLSCGFRIPATTGTDAMMWPASRAPRPGSERTWAAIEHGFSYAGWIEAARRGRSFVSGGPALFLTANGNVPGDEIKLQSGTNRIRIRVQGRWRNPLARIELVRDGVVVASRTGEDDSDDLVLEYELEIDGQQSSWVAARTVALGANGRGSVAAHTNPIYLSGAQPLRSAAAAAFFVGEIDSLVDWMDRKGRFETPGQRENTRELFLRARAIYAARAGF